MQTIPAFGKHEFESSRPAFGKHEFELINSSPKREYSPH